MKRLHLTIGVILTSILLLNPAYSYRVVPEPTNPVAPQPTSVHLTLGNPSNATTDTSNRNNFLMVKPQYALSYNNSKRIPNWVSWHLVPSHLGGERRGDFMVDNSLPSGFNKVKPTDYRGSGFDRGHMCPSGDRTANREDNDATFVMTNMIPQHPDNNQGPWADLEEECRRIARRGFELYIVCGGVGSQGEIERSDVDIPEATWKVILVLPSRQGNDIARITRATRVIAVLMPNEDGIREDDWRDFRVSVDEIEQKTGLDLFSAIPTAIQNDLERRVDTRRN
jgi:endonuclease G